MSNTRIRRIHLQLKELGQLAAAGGLDDVPVEGLDWIENKLSVLIRYAKAAVEKRTANPKKANENGNE